MFSAVNAKHALQIASGWRFLQAHHEAHALHRVDELGCLRAFYFLQVADINIEQVVIAIEAFAPHPMVSPGATAPCCERIRKTSSWYSLLESWMCGAAAHIVIGLVELQIADAQDVGFVGLRLKRLGAPLQRPQPPAVLLLKRFNEVVINARIEGFHLVFDFVVAGEHQHRHRHAGGSDAAADIQSGEVGRLIQQPGLARLVA